MKLLSNLPRLAALAAAFMLAAVPAIALAQADTRAAQPVTVSKVGTAAIATGSGATNSGTQRVVLPTDQVAIPTNATQAGTWNIGTITTLPSIPAGSALIGKVGIDQTTPGTTNTVADTCKYTTTPTTITTGNWGNVGCDANSNVDVTFHAVQVTASMPIATSAVTCASYATEHGNTVCRPFGIFGYAFNGNNFEYTFANNNSGALITASGATTSQTGGDQTNYSQRCGVFVLDMTSVGTGSVTLNIQGKDNASGKYYTILSGAAVVTNSTNVYQVCPGSAGTANVSANFPLPRTWRVTTTANNANATTYTVGASLTN